MRKENPPTSSHQQTAEKEEVDKLLCNCCFPFMSKGIYLSLLVVTFLHEHQGLSLSAKINKAKSSEVLVFFLCWVFGDKFS